MSKEFSPKRRMFLKYSLLATAGIAVSGGGVFDFLANTNPRIKEIKKDVNSRYPEQSESDLQRAEKTIKKFSDSHNKIGQDGEVDLNTQQALDKANVIMRKQSVHEAMVNSGLRAESLNIRTGLDASAYFIGGVFGFFSAVSAYRDLKSSADEATNK